MSDKAAFEETLSDEWSHDLGVIEVPLDSRPLWYLGFVVVALGIVVAGRIAFISFVNGELYSVRAEGNLYQFERTPAPRGLITDRNGVVLAENRPVFSALLDLRAFSRADAATQEKTIAIAQKVLGVTPDEFWGFVNERTTEQSGDPIVLSDDISQSELVALSAESPLTIRILDSFKRVYPKGPITASVIGYLGFPTATDLSSDPKLYGGDSIGKAGVEAFYDKDLRGTPGIATQVHDAKGEVLVNEKTSDPKLGKKLRLTIDAELQTYFYKRFQQSLAVLGRTSGVAIAMNPQNGEVLALINFPSFDNNVFQTRGKSDERRALLTSPHKPLFSRATSGLYSPGSTIKPLHGLAALAEGVIDPTHSIFSPGYIDIPNPYDDERPTRALDWQYQGSVDLSGALAQSSDVYFYIIGGGSPERAPGLGPEWDGDFGIKGLGITRLVDWWKKFHLDKETGIDLLHEEAGFLPTPEWKKTKRGVEWFLGDSYNVSIGQGDLAITPLALLNYVSAVANGGTLYEPRLNSERGPTKVLADLTQYGAELKEVQKGMRETVTSPKGTARLLNDLALPVAGKTGSAQVMNNTQENAFFVGYAPYENPQIAILILVENSREGSLNAVPIAKDVFSWYDIYRIPTN